MSPCNLNLYLNNTCFWLVNVQMKFHHVVHTCCSPLCMLAVLPAPVSPDAAVREWNGSSSGWGDPDGLSLSVHQNPPGSNPTQMPLGLFGKPGENCWPVKEASKSRVSVWLVERLQSWWCHKCYLAGVSSAQIQHVKEEAELTGQTELLLTQVILYQAPDWLQEIQHLPRHTRSQRLKKFQSAGTTEANTVHSRNSLQRNKNSENEHGHVLGFSPI